jgi:hypothetical protein
MIYENVVEEFNKKGCKLLVTKEEYNNIITITRKNYELHYRHKWLTPFIFKYASINETSNKTRLLNLLK